MKWLSHMRTPACRGRNRRARGAAFAGALALLILTILAPLPAAAQSCSTLGFTINYGILNPASSGPVDTSATVDFLCTGTPGATVRLCIELGPGTPTITGGYRAASRLGSLLQHELFADSARSVIWGSWGNVVASYVPYPNGVQVDTVLSVLGTSTPSVPVYGRVYGGQTGLAAGVYSASGTDVGVRYGYADGTSCPTGSMTDTGSLTTNAVVNANCFVSATAINFGAVADLNSTIDATGTITVQCTFLETYYIELNAGLGSGATVNNRLMTGSGGTVSYGLYSNSSRTLVWGDTWLVNTVSDIGTGSDQNFTVYARVPAQATPTPGTYSDTITVTIIY